MQRSSDRIFMDVRELSDRQEIRFPDTTLVG